MQQVQGLRHFVGALNGESVSGERANGNSCNALSTSRDLHWGSDWTSPKVDILLPPSHVGLPVMCIPRSSPALAEAE